VSRVYSIFKRRGGRWNVGVRWKWAYTPEVTSGVKRWQQIGRVGKFIMGEVARSSFRGDSER